MNKMEQYERGYVKIDLGAMESNMQAIKKRVGAGIGVMGIVKADGYGHGAVPVAKTIEPYVEGYGVATIDEALILRRHGIQKPILVLGVTPQMRFDDLLNCNISPAIFQYEKAERLSKRARILGRVCMDQMMVDVTDIPDVEEGDTVTLIGKDGGEQITVEELAERSGGFHYEIICGIGMRVPRVYVKNGAIVGTKDYFGDEYFGFD